MTFFETLLTFHQLMLWKDAIFKFVKLENFRNVDGYLLMKSKGSDAR